MTLPNHLEKESIYFFYGLGALEVMKKVKDSFLSSIIRRVLSTKIEDYGEIVSFSIDSNDKNIIAEVMLKGEKDTLTIKISQYSILDLGNKKYFTFGDLHTSREWLTILIQEYLARFSQDRRIEIPHDYARLAKLVL